MNKSVLVLAEDGNYDCPYCLASVNLPGSEWDHMNGELTCPKCGEVSLLDYDYISIGNHYFALIKK